MFRRLALIPACFLLAACGNFVNPFADNKPFVPTAVPEDFTIIVDENHDSFANRQHIQQVIKAKESISRTTYTFYRDYNDSISNRFTQETVLTPAQLQDMWNTVASKNLIEGSALWINWLSDANVHQRNSYIIQILANGRTRTYRQTNGFSDAVRPLMQHVNNVRLPISQDSTTLVVGASAPASMPATVPATRP